MAWKPVKITQTGSKPVAVRLVSMKYKGKMLGIGRCSVSIGGAPMDAIAVKYGKEQHITLDTAAPEWLAIKSKMPLDQAQYFVLEGLREFDGKPPLDLKKVCKELRDFISNIRHSSNWPSIGLGIGITPAEMDELIKMADDAIKHAKDD